jgi:carbon-monoxide dehydrogenase medium subunit
MSPCWAVASPPAGQLCRRGEAGGLAGGQPLGLMLNLRLVQPERLADLRYLPGYAGVTQHGDKVRIGAGTTHAAIEDGTVPGRLGVILAGAAHRLSAGWRMPVR